MSSISLRNEHVQWEKGQVTTWTPYHENGQVYQVVSEGYQNIQQLFRDSKRFKDRDFLIDETGRRSTFSNTIETGETLSEALRDQAFSGVSIGDRVGVCGKNSLEWIYSFLAISFSGLTVIPMNSWWTSRELEYAIKHADLKIIFADGERIERLMKISPEVLQGLKIISLDNNQESKHGVMKFSDWINHGKTVSGSSPLVVHPDSRAMIMYTSGTTNFPKGVVLTHRGICHAISVLPKSKKSSTDSTKACLLTVPLFHATGLYGIFFTSLLLGRKIVILKKWNPEKALELIEKEKVTHFTGVPTMILDMLSSPELKKRNISSLKNVGSGGAPPPAGVAKSVKEKLKASPSQGYGLTEVNATATTISAAEYEKRPTSCGKPIPGVEIQIWDEEKDVPIPVGQVGRVLIRGPTVMLEYWKDYQATVNAITKDGWFKSGVRCYNAFILVTNFCRITVLWIMMDFCIFLDDPRIY